MKTRTRTTKWGSTVTTRETGELCGCCGKKLVIVSSGDHRYASTGAFCNLTCALAYANAAYTAGWRLATPLRKVSYYKLRHDDLYRMAVSTTGGKVECPADPGP